MRNKKLWFPMEILVLCEDDNGGFYEEWREVGYSPLPNENKYCTEVEGKYLIAIMPLVGKERFDLTQPREMNEEEEE